MAKQGKWGKATGTQVAGRCSRWFAAALRRNAATRGLMVADSVC